MCGIVSKDYKFLISTFMKSIEFKAMFMVLGLTAIAYSCDKIDSPGNTEEILSTGAQVPVLEVKSDGISTFNLAAVTPPFDSTADLNADEIEFIYAVREDEKVARDLYKAFFDNYKLKTFENISKAEANHMKAAEKLLDYYEVEYPAASDYGKFADTARQALYERYLQKGNTAMEAFKVMVYLEEENIVSYNEVLKDITNPNIKLVIENLSKASENHLRAAVRQITALGGTYQASLMTEEQYKSIIAKGFEQGKRYRYLNNGQTTNRNNRLNGNGEKRGSVNSQGVCTSAQNSPTPGSNSGKGSQGRGYRGGK